MYKIYERPPLSMSDDVKLFAINAGYRKSDIGTNWYYVRAKSARCSGPVKTTILGPAKTTNFSPTKTTNPRKKRSQPSLGM